MTDEIKPLSFNPAIVKGVRIMFTKNLFLIILVVALAGTFSSLEAASTQEYKQTFDDVTVGSLPSGWKIEATHPGGKLAEWKVTADENAKNKSDVLTITKINDTSSDVFNLCWIKEVVFQDGVIEVNIRANKGTEDQGGGVIWRAKDANNYYVARYNPLESNFRIYFVHNGDRKTLVSAQGIDIKAGEWFRLKVILQGDKIEGYLDGKKYLEATDNTFTEPGGVGLWSKADAASSFDDLSVLPLSRP